MRTGVVPPLVAAAVLVGLALLLTSALAGGGAAQTTRGGQYPRCGAETIDLSAPVISGGDVFISAPVSEVWAVHTNIAAWPTWKKDVPYVKRLDHGPLRVGSRFQWENGGLDIISTVRVLQRNRCTLWGGPGGGIDGIHLWTFTPVRGGTLVHTEESWSGARVSQAPARAKALLDASLAKGREDLKRTVEARSR